VEVFELRSDNDTLRTEANERTN